MEDGNVELQRMIDNYIAMQHAITSQVISKNNSRVIFDNGDEWRVLTATENRRGIRCNIAYIDRTIDKHIVETVIQRTMVSMPYMAYKYFYPASGSMEVKM